MIYGFDSDVAQEYSVNGAIMITNFQFWIAKNKASGKHFYDNHWWTYNSNKAMQTLFPFWSAKTIRTTFEHLKKKKVIMTANYNKSPYDRTLWFAFVDEERWLCQDKNLDSPKQKDTFAEIGTPIPDINTDIIPDNNTPPIIPPKGGKGFCEELKFLEPYCKDLEPFLAIKDFQEYEYLFPALREWLDYKVRCKKHKYATIKQIHILCRQLHDFCDGDINSATKTIETSIANNWSGVVFSNKNKTKSATKDEITEFVNLWYKFAECVDKAKKNPMYNFSFASPVVATKYEEVEKLYPRAKNNLLAMLDKFRTQKERPIIDVADLDTSEPWKFAINVLYKRWKQSPFLRGEGMVRRLDAQFFLNNVERLANPCDPIYMNN